MIFFTNMLYVLFFKVFSLIFFIDNIFLNNIFILDISNE